MLSPPQAAKARFRLTGQPPTQAAIPALRRLFVLVRFLAEADGVLGREAAWSPPAGKAEALPALGRWRWIDRVQKHERRQDFAVSHALLPAGLPNESGWSPNFIQCNQSEAALNGKVIRSRTALSTAVIVRRSRCAGLVEEMPALLRADLIDDVIRRGNCNADTEHRQPAEERDHQRAGRHRSQDSAAINFQFLGIFQATNFPSWCEQFSCGTAPVATEPPTSRRAAGPGGTQRRSVTSGNKIDVSLLLLSATRAR